MGFDIERDVIVVPLTAWCIYSLLSLFGETRKLQHIPAVGHGNILLSYWSALQHIYDPPGFLRREWRKIPPGTKFVKIPELQRWLVVPATPDLYKKIANAPDDVMSMNEAVEDFLQAEHTLQMKEIDDHSESKIVQTHLNRSLAEFVPLVHEDMVLAFEDSFPMSREDDWKSFVAATEITKIVCRITNRVLVGVPLCRDSEYISANIQHAVEVYIEAYLLPFVPGFLRRFTHNLLSPLPGRIEEMTARFQPLIDKHKAYMKNPGKENERESMTMLNWLVDGAQERNRADRDVVLRMMSLNFGVTHSTSVTFIHALYSLLSRPQFIEPLRAEVDQCIHAHGFTKEGVDDMRFVDSFLKESQRFDGMITVLGRRIAARDCVLAGVPIPKGTTVGANMVNGHFDASALGPNVEEFDPYRFVKLNEQTGRTVGLATTSVNSLTFGHGRHACPGRFLAAQEQKLMLAYFLHAYDMKLDNKDGARPKNTQIGTACSPSQTAGILLRKRRDI